MQELQLGDGHESKNGPHDLNHMYYPEIWVAGEGLTVVAKNTGDIICTCTDPISQKRIIDEHNQFQENLGKQLQFNRKVTGFLNRILGDIGKEG